MLGAKDSFEEVVTTGKHEDTSELRKAAFRFFNTHLKGDAKAKVEDTEFAKDRRQAIARLPGRRRPAEDAINAKADETFVPVADVKPPAKPEEFAAWKAGLVKELKESASGGGRKRCRRWRRGKARKPLRYSGRCPW